MPATIRRRSAVGSPSFDYLGKPSGILSPRVLAVGPEHFGIVAVDCAKASSKWMLTDFYGKVLIAPTVVDHRRDALDHAIAQISQVTASHQIKEITSWSWSRPGVITSRPSGLSRPLVMTCGLCIP
jgi:hypothetical protein